MKAEQVDQALHQKFITEGQRLVFWHDAPGEFAEYVRAGLPDGLDDVQVWNVAEQGSFAAKLRFERDGRSGQYLVYSQGEAPPAEEDWLLDIRLYSDTFHADIASLWANELGLSRLSLREQLKSRAAFLGSQDRRKKLGRIIDASDDERAIDEKMIAVLVRADVPKPFEVLRTLCQGHVEGGEFDLGTHPAVMETVEKMGLIESFWRWMGQEFGYESETPSVAGLLRALFLTELIQQTGGATQSSLAQHQLPEARRRNANVFLTQWQDSASTAESYDAIAAALAHEQHIAPMLDDLDLETIRSVTVFWEAERRVVSRLKERILSEATSIDGEWVTDLVRQRQAGHWLSGAGSDTPERRALDSAYDALLAATDLFLLQAKSGSSFSFDTPEALLQRYQTDLYRFDQAYRRYCSAARPAAQMGWDLLKALTQEVERLYDQGFLQPLGVEWSQHLDAGFLDKWQLAEFDPQQRFYARKIRPHLKESTRRRAYVIVSDALRYEAAQELVENLNEKYRMSAELSALLGVLPSYTGLGMASLLPHKTLSYNEKGDVLVDGKSTAGTELRSKHLKSVEGMACQAKDLLPMKMNEAREFIGDHRVVYIYHNVIDARGDSASTEDETFDAVSSCLAELGDLVRFCVNQLNAGKVWVTADHGFLFQQEPPGETDKSRLAHKPAHAVRTKKRYVIGRDLGPTAEAHLGSTAVTAGAEGDMQFWIPRGVQRFHFTGGARFVHGGAMPQEVVVPLITVSVLSGAKKKETRSEKVGVQVLGTRHKITTPRYRFELIQTEPVGDRRKPITLKAAVYEGSEPVTAIETVTFDSASDSMEERKKTVLVELRSGTFDKRTEYRLILRDAETGAEVQSLPVVIDRSFDDDF